jgi:hypothetical protein
MGGNGCSAGQTALAVGGDVLKGVAIAAPVSGALAKAGAATESITTAARGMSELGGIMTSETNAAGGTLVTAAGKISQSDVAGAVNSAMYSGGDINILSGVHGLADGTMVPEASFFQADQAAFGNLPGVTVHDISSMSDSAISDIANGPGTTIGAFCDSGACLASYSTK